jgi:hypothetical protein
MAFKFKKAGGGFLNNVSGLIAGYAWEETTWGEGDKAYRTLTLKLMVLPDGATEAVPQFLPAGFLYEGQSISEDGLTLLDEKNEDGVMVAEDSDVARFLTTLAESGFAEDRVPENLRNLEGIVNQRVTFAKELNKERQMAAGRKALKIKGDGFQAGTTTYTEEQVMVAGKRKDKKDKTKSYNHDRLIVTAYLGEGEAPKAAAKSKSAAKPAVAAPKAAAAKGGKANGAAKTATDVSADMAEGVLLGILADAPDQTVSKAKLTSLIIQKALADGLDKDTREALRGLITSDEFLARENGWSFDAADKKQPISIAA